MPRHKKKCTSFDAFGYPIGVYYKGESHFNTKLGTLLTFILSLVLFVYMAARSLNFAIELTSNRQVTVNNKNVNV